MSAAICWLHKVIIQILHFGQKNAVSEQNTYFPGMNQFFRLFPNNIFLLENNHKDSKI